MGKAKPAPVKKSDDEKAMEKAAKAQQKAQKDFLSNAKQAQLYKGSAHYVKDAGHNDVAEADPQGYIELLRGFVASLQPGQVGAATSSPAAASYPAADTV